MTKQDDIFKKIAESLLGDYSSVYYVNAQTNEYFWYSVNHEFHSLNLEQGGDDFFKNIIRDCRKVIAEEDQHIFIEDIQKEKLLADMKKGSMQNIEYRLLINGVPTWHSLRLIRGLDENEDYFILGVLNIDEEHRSRMNQQELLRQKEAYDQITKSLAAQYDILYYIEIESGAYVEVSSTESYKKQNVPKMGDDFFSVSRRILRKNVHPEDLNRVIKIHYKDSMLKNLEKTGVYTCEFRLITNGSLKHVRHTEMLSNDGKHIIVCMKNIDDEVKTKLELSASKLKSETFTQIAESLASHYDMIYYVDAQTTYYVEFSTHR